MFAHSEFLRSQEQTLRDCVLQKLQGEVLISGNPLTLRSIQTKVYNKFTPTASRGIGPNVKIVVLLDHQLKVTFALGSMIRNYAQVRSSAYLDFPDLPMTDNEITPNPYECPSLTYEPQQLELSSDGKLILHAPKYDTHAQQRLLKKIMDCIYPSPSLQALQQSQLSGIPPVPSVERVILMLGSMG
jgi:hypothetical protein